MPRRARKYKARCWYCGDQLTRANWSRDHLVPRCHGGATMLGNIVECCRRCNNAKGDLTLEEFRAKRDGWRFYGELQQEKLA